MFTHRNGKALILALIIGAAGTVPAMAATQGTLGATSTGTASISVTKSLQAQISGISDMTLSNWSVGDGEVELTSNICVYSSTSNYRVTASGSGTASAFTIASGGNVLPYSVTWNDGGAGSLLDTGISLTKSVQSSPLQNASTLSANCNGGGAGNSTARVIVNITESDMIAATSSNTPYTGTLTMIDPDMLAQARRVLKNQYDVVLQCFVEDVARYIDDMRIAVSTKNATALVRPAHTIKSSSLNMGAVRLSGMALNLEELAAAMAEEVLPWSEDELTSRIDEIEKAFRGSCRALSASSFAA